MMTCLDRSLIRTGQIEVLNAGMDKLADRIERLEGLLDQGLGLSS